MTRFGLLPVVFPKGLSIPMFRAELDAIDIRILKELQADGRMTNVELAARAGCAVKQETTKRGKPRRGRSRKSALTRRA